MTIIEISYYPSAAAMPKRPSANLGRETLLTIDWIPISPVNMGRLLQSYGEEKRMIGESIQLDDSFDVVRLDWQPIERHPRPFKRKNPNDFVRNAFRFALTLSHMF